MARIKSVAGQSKKGKGKGENSDEGEFEVEKILKIKKIKGKNHYWLKWRGFGLDEATWEPEENLGNLSNLVKEYYAEEEARKQKKQSKKSQKADDDEEEMDEEDGEEEGEQEDEEGEGEEDEEDEEDEEEKEAPAPKKKGKQSSVAAESKKIKKAPKVEDSVNQKKGKKKAAEPVPSTSGTSRGKGKSADAKIGRFENDTASHLTCHGVFDSQNVIRNVDDKALFKNIFFQVQWKKRADGVQPTATFYPFGTIKEKAPTVLLDYIADQYCAQSGGN